MFESWFENSSVKQEHLPRDTYC